MVSALNPPDIKSMDGQTSKQEQGTKTHIKTLGVF